MKIHETFCRGCEASREGAKDAKGGFLVPQLYCGTHLKAKLYFAGVGGDYLRL